MDTIVGKDGKGAIENINGLIRQYIPKKTDFRGISSGFIAHVTEKLNNRPRKKMDLSNQKTSSKNIIHNFALASGIRHGSAMC